MTDTAEDVEPVKFPSPPYEAVMLCVPAARLDVLNCAALLATPAVPICVCPSRNVTVPVGEAEPEAGAMFAVKLTLAPEETCVADAFSIVLVPTLEGVATVTVTEFDVDAAYVASPA